MSTTASPSLRDVKTGLLQDRSLTGPDWCRAFSTAADQWLAGLFAKAAGGDGRGLALMAVGGYGRSSLAPGSDLDLLLLHDGKKRIREIADAIWYPVWDAGQALDHSVRTLKEVRTVMDSDIKVPLGLLDARLVAGDPALAAGLAERTREMWQTRASRWMAQFDDLTRLRHERFGDLAFLLEPDMKEARGGIRDVHLLRSLAKVAPVLTEVAADRVLVWADRMLTAARVELQRPTGQSGNLLLLQDQDLVATALGFSDADALMVAVADAARAIAWASDDGWRRVASWLAGPKGRGGGGDVVLEPGIVLRDGEVTLAVQADPAVDPVLTLRVAAVSAELDKPMSRTTLDRLATRTLAPEGTWPADLLQAFVRLLAAGRPAIPAIEALDQRGVWMRFLPEWAGVRNRPQRNAYHRYTVDRHLLETVSRASAIQSRVRRPDLLLLGALFHDIGKGRGGDHTDIGIEIVAALGPRLGLPPEDVATLMSLVRHHLLLPDAATRRDLEDPATAALVAQSVGDRDTLELLAALTEADSLSTGPAAWGRWKAGLVARLVEQVASTLEGRPPADNRQAALSDEERALLSGRTLRVDFDEENGLRVAAPDQSGLLATVAGVLNLAGVYVRAATTISDEETGMALLRFQVAAAFDRLPEWDRVATDLASALDGRMEIEQLLVERDARYARFQPSTAAYTPEVRVLIDNRFSPSATIVEVRAPDRGPVLYRVTRALAACGVTITCALVSTLGAEAIDVFYVSPPAGGRVPEGDDLENIRTAVLASL